jgi:phosphoglycerate dehydrogenase-like enzyme
MVKILCDVPLEETAVRQLQALPGVILQTIAPHEKAWDLPAEARRDAEILLCKQPPRDLEALTHLRMVQISTVGYDHLRQRGYADGPVRFCNARGVFDTGIGEWNLAMMIALVRDLRGMLRNQDKTRWDRDARFQQEIRGQTVGLWGYGGIGRETARLAKAFGMTVHVLTRTGVRPRVNTYLEAGTGDPDGVLPDRIYTAGEELRFLSGLDFLILALPHTRQSDAMIGERELQALPPTAFLLNPARGPIIQEPALLRALGERWIAGAALDTHFAYPLPPEHPLWRMPNVILTPHISGADKAKGYPQRIADLCLQNVSRFLANQPLLNEVTRQEWLEA